MPPATDSASLQLPRIDIIIAVFNESQTIEGKIADLEALDYPESRLRFFVVDGGSTDGTGARVARWAVRDDRVTCIESGAPDKAAQLNAALERSTAGWVLVTDADARMPPETLRVMVEESLTSSDVDVVGTLASTPGHELEAIHWRLSNWIRRRERRFGSTGLVIATCYLFRRALLHQFPVDCAADDVHIACRAAATGSRVGLANVTVFEIRAPSTVWGILGHKMQRTRGYLREVLRFMPSAARMPDPMRAVFAWRALALLGIPMAAVAAVVPVAAAALGGHLAVEVVLGATGLLATTLGAAWTLARYRPSHGSTMVVYSALTFAILSLALLSYPFVRKTASLKRIGPP